MALPRFLYLFESHSLVPFRCSIDVLDMPVDEALELSQFSHDHGMSCLGVWPREECLRLGKQLQVRDIVCRVVPYVEGGQRAWQAKDVSSGVSNSSPN